MSRNATVALIRLERSLLRVHYFQIRSERQRQSRQCSSKQRLRCSNRIKIGVSVAGAAGVQTSVHLAFAPLAPEGGSQYRRLPRWATCSHRPRLAALEASHKKVLGGVRLRVHPPETKSLYVVTANVWMEASYVRIRENAQEGDRIPAKVHERFNAEGDEYFGNLPPSSLGAMLCRDLCDPRRNYDERPRQRRGKSQKFHFRDRYRERSESVVQRGEIVLRRPPMQYFLGVISRVRYRGAPVAHRAKSGACGCTRRES